MNSMEGGVPGPQIDELFAGLQLQPDGAQKPELPPEIIEAIVDEVASQRDSEECMKICLKVARAFVYPAQKRLFATIDLTAPAERSGRRKAQKFWFHLLKSSPHIGVHVQNLAIGGDTAFRCYLPEKCERSTWTTCTWMTCAAINAVVLLPRILPLLSNLRYFNFSCSKEEPGNWLEISEANRSALEQLFEAGSLQTVKLSFITNLTSQAFAQLFYIPNLIISNVSVDDQVVEGGIHIQELSIGSDAAYQSYRPGKCEKSSWTNCTWLMGATPNTAVLPPQIFPILVNLRSLNLSFSDKAGSWLEIPEAGQLALERLFQTRSLQTANLSNITNFTSRALTRLINIPNLVLFKVTMADQVADSRIPVKYSAAGRIKLQRLTFSEFSLSITRALARVMAASPSSTRSFSKLVIVACYGATGFSDAVEELIREAGNIRQLEWPSQVYVGNTTAPVLLNMRLFPHISTLKVSMGNDNTFLLEVLYFLGRISDCQASPSFDLSNGGIKRLICYDRDCRSWLRGHLRQWHELDNMLSRPGLASLQGITIEADSPGDFTPTFLDTVLPIQRRRNFPISITNFRWGTHQNQVL